MAVFFPIRIFRRQRRRQRWSPPSRVIVHRTMPAAVGTLTLAGQAVTLTKTTAAAGTTLDPAKTSSFITLSNSNRTATRSTGTAAYVTTLSTKSGVTAELYVEATNTAGVDSGIGVSNAPMADSDSGGTINWLGWNGNSIGLYRDSIYLNGALVDSLPTTPNATDVIAVDVDRVGQEIWFRNVTKGEAWVPGGASGIDISSIGSGALYFGFTLSNPDSKTVNFDGTFVGAVPPAAVRWDGTAISGVTHYTMPATVGTLTLAGQTATLRAARKTAASRLSSRLPADRA